MLCIMTLRCTLSRTLRDVFMMMVVVVSLYLAYKTGSIIGTDGTSPRRSVASIRSVSAADKTNNNQLSESSLGGNGIMMRPNEAPSTFEMTVLFKHLLEIEDKILNRNQGINRTVFVKGQSNVINRDFSLYEQAFRKRGFKIKLPVGFTYIAKETNDTFYSNTEDEQVYEDTIVVNDLKPQISGENVEWEGWLVLLCMTFTDGDNDNCLHKTSYAKLSSYQKINRIPGVRNTLWRKDGFCQTMSIARRQLPSLKGSPLSPPCWVLPEQFKQFLDVSNALGNQAYWLFKSTIPGGNIQLLQPTKPKDYNKIQQYKWKKAVVQQYFASPLLVFGMPISVRAYVLVTSITPLRAFLHTEGLVNYRQDYQRSFKKVPNKIWYFAQLKQYLKHNYGGEAAETAFKNLETIIVKILLVAEASLAAHFGSFSTNFYAKDLYRCEHCFQLLGFDLIFNSSLYPVVIEVNGQPHMKAKWSSNDSDGWASNTIKQNAVDDTIAIIFSNISVAAELADVLEKLKTTIGIVGVNCESSHKFCITNQDLEYLLDTRRERLNKGSFQMIYPSSNGDKYSSLVMDLERLKRVDFISQQSELHSFKHNKIEKMNPTSLPEMKHSTGEFHQLTSKIEMLFHAKELRNTIEKLLPIHETEDMKIKNKKNPGYIASLVDNIFDDQPFQDSNKLRCSQDHGIMPYLSELKLEPEIVLSPAFEPSFTEYHVTVLYDQVLIQVTGVAASCNCEARLDDKNGLSKASNYTLGIGLNKLNMHVVDITHTEPWIINTYTVYIYRKKITQGEAQFNNELHHQACSLVQDCELKVYKEDKCGLQPFSNTSWPQFMNQADSLSPCHQGDVSGHWVVPCVRCQMKESCFWKQAVWQPYTCRHTILPREHLKKCLSGKKVFFIGDSTNRGIMYYLMEQLNGTLWEWDKTHNTKVYTNLNQHTTTVSFAYYPQFWLPTEQRPVFDKAMHQLIKRIMPLENNTNTVLVVGGVHWLGVHHLNVIQESLLKLGLSGIKKIMKSLGAGFHQNVDGVHCLTLEEQRKVMIHNAGLKDYATKMGFDVIDTLTITMPRFKEFLQGKCACHFHKVKKMLQQPHKTLSEAALSSEELMKLRLDQPYQLDSDDSENFENEGWPYQYHVEGPINSLYSEILINRICDI